LGESLGTVDQANAGRQDVPAVAAYLPGVAMPKFLENKLKAEYDIENTSRFMLSPDEQQRIFAKAIEQLLKLSRDDKAFLRQLHISPE
jgi:hypothetical protein